MFFVDSVRFSCFLLVLIVLYMFFVVFHCFRWIFIDFHPF